ncbi:MAG: hypothetical protein AAFV86_22015 [Pseudomonadota bacterium]
MRAVVSPFVVVDRVDGLAVFFRANPMLARRWRMLADAPSACFVLRAVAIAAPVLQGPVVAGQPVAVGAGPGAGRFGGRLGVRSGAGAC